MARMKSGKATKNGKSKKPYKKVAAHDIQFLTGKKSAEDGRIMYRVKWVETGDYEWVEFDDLENCAECFDELNAYDAWCLKHPNSLVQFEQYRAQEVECKVVSITDFKIDEGVPKYLVEWDTGSDGRLQSSESWEFESSLIEDGFSAELNYVKTFKNWSALDENKGKKFQNYTKTLAQPIGNSQGMDCVYRTFETLCRLHGVEYPVQRENEKNHGVGFKSLYQVRQWFTKTFLKGNVSRLRWKGKKYNLVAYEKKKGNSIVNQVIPDGNYFCMVQMQSGLHHTFALKVIDGRKLLIENIKSTPCLLLANSVPIGRGKWICILPTYLFDDQSRL